MSTAWSRPRALARVRPAVCTVVRPVVRAAGHPPAGRRGPAGARRQPTGPHCASRDGYRREQRLARECRLPAHPLGTGQLLRNPLQLGAGLSVRRDAEHRRGEVDTVRGWGGPAVDRVRRPAALRDVRPPRGGARPTGGRDRRAGGNTGGRCHRGLLRCGAAAATAQGAAGGCVHLPRAAAHRGAAAGPRVGLRPGGTPGARGPQCRLDGGPAAGGGPH